MKKISKALVKCMKPFNKMIVVYSVLLFHFDIDFLWHNLDQVLRSNFGQFFHMLYMDISKMKII